MQQKNFALIIEKTDLIFSLNELFEKLRIA